MKTIKICGITTRPGTAKIMVPMLTYVSDYGYNGYIICQPCDDFSDNKIAPLTYIPVEMNRGAVNPIEVLKCTYRLFKIFRRERFDVIQYASSNASLYAAMAGFLARTPVRIFCQWGMPYPDYVGWKHKFFKFLERFTCMLSTNVQPDSLLNQKLAIREGLFPDWKGNVLGKGSAQGVNMSRFNIEKKAEWRKEIHTQYGIGESTKVFCFVGRIVPQKGVNELLEAFMRLDKSDTFLFVVGAPDEIDSLNQSLLAKARSMNNVVFTGGVSNPEKYHASADYFVIPSYREGFPNTILEAGALGIPSIVTRINGMINLIEDRKTGFVCDVKSADSLYAAMLMAYALGKDEYKQLSENVYAKVKNNFDSEYVKKFFLEDRNRLTVHLRK